VKHALNVTREQDFAAWYQAVIAEADLAEESGVRGCMVMRPWGYGIWERIQRLLDDRIKCRRPRQLLFPAVHPAFLFREGSGACRGFRQGNGGRHASPAGRRRQGRADARSHREAGRTPRRPPDHRDGDRHGLFALGAVWRDLPVQINQWANVVRWEMRTRMFLRTSEFLWQEGHTAYASAEEAREETLKMLEVYRSFAEDCLALPVIAGEKPENERFPGAVATYSIEAMMQDGKALQAGTSHFLGTNFASAQNIRFQNARASWNWPIRRAGVCPPA
jgi:prolyl-tRNA synthetase